MLTRPTGLVLDDALTLSTALHFRECDPTRRFGTGGPVDDRPPHRFQIRRPTCTSMTMLKCLYTLERRAGNETPPVASASWFYWIGRKAEQYMANPTTRGMPPLTGVSVQDLVRAVQQSGYVEENVWRYDEDRLNDPPSPLITDVAAFPQAGLRAYLIAEKGTRLVDEMLRANDSGYALFWCTRVDQPFMEWKGDGVVQRISKFAVDFHAMMPWRFEPKHVVVVNHWQGHGYDEDLVNVSYDVFADPDVTTYMYAVSALPNSLARNR